MSLRLPWQQPSSRFGTTWEITCPRDLPYDAVLALMRALSGTLRGGAPPPSVAIEVYGDVRGLRFFVTAPEQLAISVQRLITTHLAGAAITVVTGADDLVRATAWSTVIEIGPSNAREPLRIPSPPAAVATLLAAFTGLRDDQALAQQWIITGGRSPRPVRRDGGQSSWSPRPVDAAAHKRKYEAEPVLRVTGRLAVRSPAPEALLARLRGPYAALSTHGVQMRRRLASPQAALEGLRRRELGGLRLATLNAAELAVVSGLPFGRPAVAGLPVVRARRLAADHTIPRTGLVVARSTYPGDERPIALSARDLLKHVHLQGKTGVGKSALMVNLAAAQAEAGYGVGLLDPTGDTAADLLERIPPHRAGDVVVFDPTDTEWPVGFNVLDGRGNPEVVADQLMAIFHGIYRDSGILTGNYLRGAIQALASVPGYTLAELVPFMTDPGFRSGIVRQLADPLLRDLWQRFDGERGAEQLRLAQPAIHRVQPLLLRRSVRLTLGQADSRLDMARVLRERKILIAALPKGPLGEETSALLGAVLFARLYQAAASQPRGERWPFFLHLDECQNFLHTPIALSDALAESRKYELGLTLGHQHMGQLPAPLRSAIQANTRTKICFAISSEDALGTARELGPPVEPVDLAALGRYECVIQTVADDQPSAPATARTLPPVPPCSDPQVIRAASRARWARPREEVEAAILARQRPRATGQDRTNRGWEAS
ncbi:hypothetical protein VM98_24880 [Streptomyces rubellomurinus subsp. indigoferus]|nr:hypothetical protein VM98_24880 [Streptomyces rubellomurinus subsp. indigoferus]